ncbi:MAG: hypothetical protein EHM28_11080 [Spirochaetaceae bacterium]|nr:MAG: hypothetical protein EHM28_11080 [Spirochaetaceae bacterium]
MSPNPANGRKVFFLYPNALVKEMIKDFIRHEFEVYSVDNHIGLKSLLKKYQNTILFINIEERLKEDEWEAYIKSILSDPDSKGTGIGVFTYFDRSKALTEKYLLELGVNCGFIRLKTDIKKCKDIILKTLEANEARGKRLFIRGICNPRVDTFNLFFNGSRYNGRLLDVSIAGFAGQFTEAPPKVEAGQLLRDIQIVLRGGRFSLDGQIIRIDRRKNDSDLFIVLFKPDKMTPDIRNRIHDFITMCLQNAAEQELQR